MEQGKIIDTFGTYQLSNCNLFTQHSYLSSFGRETSLVNIMGPRSIFPPFFTLQSLTAFVYFLLQSPLLFPLLCLILCVNNNPEGLTTPLYSLGEKLFVVV